MLPLLPHFRLLTNKGKNVAFIGKILIDNVFCGGEIFENIKRLKKNFLILGGVFCVEIE